MLKNFFAVFLSVIFIIFAVLPLGVFTVSAEDEYTSGYYRYTVSNNEATIVGYTNYSENANLIIPSHIDGYTVTGLGGRAFGYHSNIKSVFLPESIINIDTINNPFYFCSSIESIIVKEGNFKYKSVDNCLIDIQSKTLLLGCKNSIIPSDGSVAIIGSDAFTNCLGLINIDIPNTILGIESSAFSYCRNLQSIHIPQSVTYISDYNVFMHCDNLSSITVDINNKYYHSENNCLIDTAAKTLISGCNTSIIPNDGSVVKIGGMYTFSGCTFTNFVIPYGVEVIGNGAFNACYSLINVVIPNSIKTVAEDAFRLTNIRRIVLPESIENISRGIFADTNIKDIYYVGTKSDKEKIRIASDNIELLSATWHYNTCSINSHIYDNSSDKTCNLCGWIRFPEVESLEINDVIYEGFGYKDESGHYIYDNIYPSFTVKLKDGRTLLSSSGSIEIDSEWYWLNVDTSIQYNEPWTAGNTYQVTGTILGVSDTFNVTITENPIANIIVEDIEIIENTHGYYDEEHDSYIYSPFPESFTAILTDGREIKFGNSVSSITSHYSQEEHPWTVGNTYQMTGYAYGCSDTFNVTIVKSPVVSIDVEDITCIEGTRGNYVVDDGGYYFYDDIYFRLNYTVTLEDGSVIKASEPNYTGGGGGDHGIYIDGEFYEISNVIDNQDISHWGIGTHTAIAEFLGVTDEFNVIITETPVAEIEIDDMEIIEYTHGYYRGDTYIYGDIYPNFTVVMKDGSRIESNGSGVEIDNVWYSLYVDTSSQYDKPWSAGNTYEVTASILGASGTFNVTITETPVAEIEIDDMEIIEYTHGDYSGDTYIYNNIYPNFTAVMKDGSRIESNGSGVEIDNVWYSLYVDTSSQYDKPWSAGNTYEVTASILGASGTFNVTITETPVAEIEIDDMEIIEYTHGDWNGDQYIYQWLEPSGKAIMKDGSERIIKCDGSGSYYGDGRSSLGFKVDGEEYSLFMDLSSQFEQSWTAGNTYQIMCSALGMSDSFNITVTESPIAEIEIDDLTLIQGLDSYNGGDYEYYNLYPTFTVTFKDGTEKKISESSGINIGGSWCNLDIEENQDESPFEAGNTYELTGRLGGCTDTFTVTVEESPIDWIEVLKTPDKTEYYVFELPVLNGLQFKIHYKDGAHEDFSVESSCPFLTHYPVFSEKLQKTGIIWTSKVTTVGKQTITDTQLFGTQIEIPITVLENPAVAVSVKEGENKSPVLTVTKNDGTTEDWKILSNYAYYFEQDENFQYTWIHTDHGYFGMKIKVGKNDIVFGLLLSEDNIIESNAFAKNEWTEVYALCSSGISSEILSWLGETQNEHFAGRLTAENIDETIRYVLDSSDSWSDEDNALESGETYENQQYELYSIYRAGDLKQELLKYLALDEIDLSLSERYDPQTDTYRFAHSLSGNEFLPYRLEYCDGIWTAEYYQGWEDSLVCYLKLNDEHKILRIDDKANKYGDIDGNEEINDWDGVLFARYLADWDINISSQQALDIDKDGEVTDWDSVLLDRYLAGWNIQVG